MTFKSLALILLTAASCAAQDALVDTMETVGPKPDGRVVTPVSQIVEPIGRQIYLPGLRPQAIALSPDGRILVTAGKTRDLIVVDPVSAQVTQTVPLPSDASVLTNQLPSEHILSSEAEQQLSFTGLIFSRDGSRIYLSNVGGSVKVFGVDADHRVLPPLFHFPAPGQRAAAQSRSPRRPGALARRQIPLRRVEYGQPPG